MRHSEYVQAGYTAYTYTHVYVNPNHTLYGLSFEAAMYFKSEHDFLLWCNELNHRKDIDYAALPIDE